MVPAAGAVILVAVVLGRVAVALRGVREVAGPNDVSVACTAFILCMCMGAPFFGSTEVLSAD